MKPRREKRGCVAAGYVVIAGLIGSASAVVVGLLGGPQQARPMLQQPWPLAAEPRRECAHYDRGWLRGRKARAAETDDPCGRARPLPRRHVCGVDGGLQGRAAAVVPGRAAGGVGSRGALRAYLRARHAR